MAHINLKHIGDPDGEDSSRQTLSPQVIQTVPFRPAQQTSWHTAPENAEADSLNGYWRILRRWKWVLCLSGLAGAVAGLAITIPQKPHYESRVSLEIQSLNQDFLNMREVSPTASNYSTDSYMQTQIKLLGSEALVYRAYGKLKNSDLPDEKQIPLRLAGLRAWLGLPQTQSAPPIDEALDIAARSIKVNGAGMTSLVEIRIESTRPMISAEFANTVANEYIQQNLEVRWELSQQVSEWLIRQLQEMKESLEASEATLYSRARNSGTMFSSERENLNEERMRQLQAELFRAQADRVVKQSRYELAKSGSLSALPDVLDDATLRDYKTKRLELRREMANLIASLTPEHPRVRRLQAQIEELSDGIGKEGGNILERIEGEFETASRREKLLESAYLQQAKVLSEEAGKAVQYSIAKREVDTHRQIYDGMLQKVKEAAIASAIPLSNARIVDFAKPAKSPSKPDPLLHSALGLMSGVFLCLVLIVARDRADSSFRSQGDLSTYLRVPELGIIPRAKLAPAPVGAPSRFLPFTRDREEGAVHPELAISSESGSFFSESFNSVLASILLDRAKGLERQVLVVTSPGPGEGKTLVSTNLAVACARSGKRVLLVDADFRRPRLHVIFGIPNDTGLSDLLLGINPLAELPPEAGAQKTQIEGLMVLPSGSGVDASLSQLFYTPRSVEFMEWIRKNFDTVFIDTPPSLHLADARVLARHSDGVLLTVRSGRTSREATAIVVRRFLEDGTSIIGTILNHWEPSGDQAYYGSQDYNRYFKESKKRRPDSSTGLPG
jgi:polysaccharide biosynthesis transport protein